MALVLAAVPGAGAGPIDTRDVAAQQAYRDAGRHYTVVAGFGVEGFMGEALRDLVGIGPSWNVRVGWGNPEALIAEAGYAGSRQSLRNTSGTLDGHGAQAVFRVNVAPELPFDTFFFFGAGWSRFIVSGMPTVALETRSDDVLEFPLGIGSAYRHGRLAVDVRIGVRVISGPDLIMAPEMVDGSEDSEMMHRYGLTANVGFEL